MKTKLNKMITLLLCGMLLLTVSTEAIADDEEPTPPAVPQEIQDTHTLLNTTLGGVDVALGFKRRIVSRTEYLDDNLTSSTVTIKLEGSSIIRDILGHGETPAEAVEQVVRAFIVTGEVAVSELEPIQVTIGDLANLLESLKQQFPEPEPEPEPEAEP